MTLIRYCFALDLHDDPALIERYKVWHSPGQVPAAVILCTPRQRHPLTTGLNLSADEARWLAETLGQSLQLPLRLLTSEP